MSKQLDDLCLEINSKYGSPAEVKPGDLANYFVFHSGLSTNPGLAELHDILKQYGVREITPADLQGHLKAHHSSYRGQDYTVIYEKDLYVGSVEHAMLHELYEIISERCQDYCPGYKAPPIPEICLSANHFAASALMQPGVVLNALFDTGFDIVQLHLRFFKAYSSIAMRVIEVLNALNQDKPFEDPLDLMVVLYERQEEGDPQNWGICNVEKFKVTYSVKTRGIKLGSKGKSWLHGGSASSPNYKAPRYPRHLIPNRGDTVVAGSIVMNVVNDGVCCCLHKATGFDMWGTNDLTLIAQPVLWYGKLAKIILVGMRYKDGRLLNAQRNSLYNPNIIEESYQLI